MYKWKSRNNTEEESSQQKQPYIINIGHEESQQQYTSSTIRLFENKLFFYGIIDDESILELNRLLIELDTKLQSMKNVLDGYEPTIHLRLNTPGGDITSAFACIDIIRNLKTKVYTYADGQVASAGTLIIAVGKQRFIGKHGVMLIHQLSTFFEGKFSELEDTYANASLYMKVVKDFYKQYTKLPMKKVDEMLKHDIFLTAEECVQYGLVDTIL